MWRLSILEWDALGNALDAHEQPEFIGSELSRILNHLGYSEKEVFTIAKHLIDDIGSDV